MSVKERLSTGIQKLLTILIILSIAMMAVIEWRNNMPQYETIITYILGCISFAWICITLVIMAHILYKCIDTGIRFLYKKDLPDLLGKYLKTLCFLLIFGIFTGLVAYQAGVSGRSGGVELGLIMGSIVNAFAKGCGHISSELGSIVGHILYAIWGGRFL